MEKVMGSIIEGVVNGMTWSTIMLLLFSWSNIGTDIARAICR